MDPYQCSRLELATSVDNKAQLPVAKMSDPAEDVDFQNIKKQPKSVDPINLINSMFGEDLETLDTAKKLYKHYQIVANDIQKQVSESF